MTSLDLPRAYVTLLTDEGFLSGALCLLRSLSCTRVPSTVPTRVVMVTPAVGKLSRARLRRVGATVVEVDPIPLRPLGGGARAAAEPEGGTASTAISLLSASAEAGSDAGVAPPSGPSAASGSSLPVLARSHVPSWTDAGELS